MLNDQERKRYSRHLLMPNFGVEGQQKLKNAKVLVVGAGGLGTPVLQYLAAAGVGRIGIVENDTIDLSNLQRQVIYGEHQVGESKLAAAIVYLQKLNSTIQLVGHELRLSASNAFEIIEPYDLVVDTCDNFETRYLVNDACEILNKPFVYGAIHQFEGQVAVFNLNGGVSYRDLFAMPPPPELAPNCSEAGVLGVLPGIIGSMQANEAIKILAEIGEPLRNKLLVFDALSMTSRIIKLEKPPNRIKPTQLIDYKVFCGINKSNFDVSSEELKSWQKSDYQLIDVRTAKEYDLENLGALNIPLNEIPARIAELLVLMKTKKLVLHCRSGARSKKALALLQEVGLEGVYDLVDPKF